MDHLGSATVVRGSDFQVYHGHRNMVWTYLKNMPVYLMLLCLPLHLFINFAALIKYSLRGRPGVIWRAKFDAIRGIPSVLRKRAAVQRNREAATPQLWALMDKRLFRSRFD